MVIFLLHKKTRVARLIAQNQNGQTLMEATGGFQWLYSDLVLVQPRMSFRQDRSSVLTYAEKLTFATSKVHLNLLTLSSACIDSYRLPTQVIFAQWSKPLSFTSSVKVGKVYISTI